MSGRKQIQLSPEMFSLLYSLPLETLRHLAQYAENLAAKHMGEAPNAQAEKQEA